MRPAWHSKYQLTQRIHQLMRMYLRTKYLQLRFPSWRCYKTTLHRCWRRRRGKCFKYMQREKNTTLRRKMRLLSSHLLMHRHCEDLIQSIKTFFSAFFRKKEPAKKKFPRRLFMTQSRAFHFLVSVKIQCSLRIHGIRCILFPCPIGSSAQQEPRASVKRIYQMLNKILSTICEIYKCLFLDMKYIILLHI